MEGKELLQAIGKMLNESLDPIKEELSDIKQRVTKIEITQEQITDRKIQTLLEGQQGMNEKFKQLDKLTADVEDIKITVNALEAMTKTNTTEIKELKLVK